MIENTVKRIVRRLFPELTANLHLPQWGRVKKIHAVDGTARSTQPEPLYCVDVQVLDASGRADTAVPVLPKVPLPAPGAGVQRGFYGYPKLGALVELGFILGHPDKPFVRAVLVQDATVPALGERDQLLAVDAENYYRMVGDGNISEQCQAVAERFADLKQRVVVKDGGTVWLGNESSNVLRILDDLIKVTSAIADTASSHTHEYTDNGSPLKTKMPDQAGDFSGQKGDADSLDAELAPIVDE